MTDHANELRRYSRKIGHPAGDVPSVMLAAAEEIERLRASLEVAETDAAHQKTLAESALRVAEGWERKCDALRAKVAEMEQQEPVAWRTFDGEGGYDYRSYEDNENYKLEWDARNPNHIGWVEPLYALPGAKGEEK